jgi:hypothetical protein
MSSATAVPDALAARGLPVTLADGSTVLLRYTFASLRRLDAEFVNVARMMTVVKDAAEALEASHDIATGHATDEARAIEASYTGPSIFDVLIQVLAPGLLDEVVTHPRTGEQIYLGEHEDAVERLLDVSRLQEYLTAFGRAFNQAFDTGEVSPVDPPQSPSRSRGTPGGTSRSAKAAAPRRRSGS